MTTNWPTPVGMPAPNGDPEEYFRWVGTQGAERVEQSRQLIWEAFRLGLSEGDRVKLLVALGVSPTDPPGPPTTPPR